MGFWFYRKYKADMCLSPVCVTYGACPLWPGAFRARAKLCLDRSDKERLLPREAPDTLSSRGDCRGASWAVGAGEQERLRDAFLAGMGFQKSAPACALPRGLGESLVALCSL